MHTSRNYIECESQYNKQGDLRFSGEGTPIFNYIIPVPCSDSDLKPCWLKAVTFGELALWMSKLPLGIIIVSIGSIQGNRWTTPEGVDKIAFEFIVRRVGIFTSFTQPIDWFVPTPKPKDENTPTPAAPPHPETPAANEQYPLPDSPKWNNHDSDNNPNKELSSIPF